jgi:hypothetical protein
VKRKTDCSPVFQSIVLYRRKTWTLQDEFEIDHSRVSKMGIGSCRYAKWVNHLWKSRVNKLLHLRRYYSLADRDFMLAANAAHAIFTAVSVHRLYYRADVEGGHGRWVWNKRGSGAGGWFQFMEGTFYARSDEAFAEARRRGFTVPMKYNSFYSMLGQTITAAYMFSIGLECTGEGWAASC